MPLGDRIRELRTEHGWSQNQLAEHVGTDARQISRYENGRITPSLDVAARIAETFNTSLDYLAIENTQRRPLHTPTTGLETRLNAIAELTEQDLTTLTTIIDALITKHRVHTLTNTAS